MNANDDATQPLDRAQLPDRALNLDLDDPRDRRFADYELIERIGGGGMGVVYRARQLSLDREVAIKIFAYDAVAIDDLLSRFHSEARHAGRLQHPNIVPVYEIGTHENLHFFSMGLVRGPTLGVWLREAPRTPVQLARLLRVVAEAVEYAHRVGILHLDLKPGNVLIDERGAPQVADFGLAHRISDAAEGRVPAAGTPAYMAPEQADQTPRLSPATDIWGLGAILYEMLSGSAPWASADGEASLLQLRRAGSEPRALTAPGLPADLVAVCRRCLARDPGLRYASARDLADDLQRYIDGRPVSVRRPGWVERALGWMRREPRIALLAGILAVTLVTGLAVTFSMWLHAEGLRAEAQATLFTARRQGAWEAQARGDPYAGLSALIDNIDDAERAGSTRDAELDRLRVGALLARVPRQIASLAGGGEGRSVAFAEDGRLLLASLRNGELAAFELPEGRERWRIVPTFPPTAWGNSFAGRIHATSDGRHAVLYPSGSSGIARPDVSAMLRVALADGSLDVPPVEREALSYAADGRSALLRSAAGWQRWRVDPWRVDGVRFDVDSQYCHLTTAGIAACAELGFRRVVFIDAATGGEIDRIAIEEGAELSAWMPSDDGRWLALGSSLGEVTIIDTASRRAQRLRADGAIADFAFDGDRLAVASTSGQVRVADLDAGRWMIQALSAGGDRMNAVVLDRARGWLVGNDGRLVVWPLRDDGEERPLPTAVVRHRGALIGMHAVAMDRQTGLIASFGSEGEIKLLRLPTRETRRVAWISGGHGDRPAPGLRVDGTVIRDELDRYWSLHQAPYRVERAGNGTIVAAAGSALYLLGDEVRRLQLPNSAQVVAVHPEAAWALVGWIEAEGQLDMAWRTLDVATGTWLTSPVRTRGLVDDVRLGSDRWAYWQGRRLRVHRRDGTPDGSLDLPEAGLRIADATFDDGGRVIIATVARSWLQPASLQRWRIDAAGGAVRERHVPTPSAHDRVFDLGDAWLGHGARVATYADTRREVLEFGSDWVDAAAVSHPLGLAAFASRGAVHVHVIDDWRPLVAPIVLPLAARDAVAEIAFDDGGLVALSHYGERHRIALTADARGVEAMRAEAHDLLPPRETPATAVDRQGRDHGHVAVPARESPAAEPAVPRNVGWRERFQGSSKGLGITDSAGWPRGTLRLRGIDVELGDALQLAPAGRALGAAEFPATGEFPVSPDAPVHLFVGNQIDGAPTFAAEWLDAQGALVGRGERVLPPSWDGPIHDPARGGMPLADVALVVRTAESRERGGGSEQLFVYHLALRSPPAATTLRLRALDGAPLVVGVGHATQSAAD